MYLNISNPAAYHAALYIRLSKEDEAEGPSQSITNQKCLLNEFAEKQGLSVYDAYVDDGFSGTSFDRPDFNRMIRDIEDHKVNMVITKDLSRLGRDYIMTGHYMERYFPEHRVRYISLLDGIDTGVESTANDITPFRAIMNDMYAKDISKKIKSVKHDKQHKGLYIGWKPPYGYKSHPDTTNKIVIDEQAAAVVRRIFSMALTGVSCRKIAAALNDDHIPTPSAYAGLTVGRPGPYTGLWCSDQISEILKNEVYIGNMIQGRTARINYKTKKCIKRPPEEWSIVKNTHEAIIDEDSFRKVGLLIESRKSTRSRTYDYLLKGMIFCHECGAPLTVINRPNAAGDVCLLFNCRTYQRYTHEGLCSSHSIKEQTVTEAVLAQIHDLCRSFLDPSQLLPVANQILQQSKCQDSALTEIQSLERKMNFLDTNLDKMYADKLAGVLEPDDFQRIYTRIKSERDQLAQELQKLQSQKRLPEPDETQEAAKVLVQKFIEEFDFSRAFLVSLVERIELSKDRELYIRFRFKTP